jgi:hypothetical protein
MKIVGIAVLVVALVALGGFALSSFVTGRDSASIDTANGPGEKRGEAGLLRGRQADVGVPGNVVLLYSQPGDEAALKALAAEIAGPPSAELEAAGQAILVRPDSQANGIVAVASTHALRATSAADPQLRAFVEAWLGNPSDG